MEIGIGAIFRDEFEYVVEWLAWHQLAGFEHFYVADNGSSDGTTALLESLSDLGFITLIHQPVLDRLSQIKAYERITQAALGKLEAVLFIDADEFLVHESFEDGKEAALLKSLLADKQVGAIGITWRLFGSSGQLNYSTEPVVERFTQHRAYEKSCHIKSISRLSSIKKNHVHGVTLEDGFQYIDPCGNEVNDFIKYERGKEISVSFNGLRKKPCTAPLMINHYVVKSKQEFMEKKVKRGDAMLGASYERNLNFFTQHDNNEIHFVFPERKINALKAKIAQLNEGIKINTIFNKVLKGHIDIQTNTEIMGWICDLKGDSKGIKLNIFVNGVYQGSTTAGFFRSDLKRKGVSPDGLNGFRWSHPAPLSAEDVVEVKVQANRFSFKSGYKHLNRDEEKVNSKEGVLSNILNV